MYTMSNQDGQEMKLPAKRLRKALAGSRERGYRKARYEFNQKLDRMLERHEEELKKVRQQEQAFWKGIVAERDEEIRRLQLVISSKRKELGYIRDAGYSLEEVSTEVSRDMESAKMLMCKAQQMVLKATNSIERHNIRFDKKSVKSFKQISEVKG